MIQLAVIWKYIQKYWKVCLFIVLCILIWYFYISWKAEKEDRIRLEQNDKAEKTNLSLMQEWTTKELKEYLPKVVKLAKDSGIKVNHITEVHKYYYTYNYKDTIILRDTIINNYHYKVGEMKDSCLIVQTLTDLATNKQIVSVDIRGPLMTFVYWNRKKVKILFFKLGIGGKEYFQKIISQCPNVKFRYEEQIKVTKRR